MREQPPVPGGLWGAIRSSPFLVILVILICTGAGVGAGLARKVEYSASSKLAVLKLNFGAAGALNGFSTAAAVLADTYARGISADGVVQPLANQFHQSVQTINGELSAAAVPQSPVFTITATTPTKTEAVALAGAAATQLLAYFESVNRSSPDRSRLYHDVQNLEVQLETARSNRNFLSAGIAAHLRATHATSLSAADRSEIAHANAGLDALQVRVNSLTSAYQQSVVSASETQFIQPLSSPVSATSDRLSKVGLVAFAGLAVGIALAVALALMLQARRIAKRRR